MGIRKIKVRKNAAENIASVALYIESKGMLATAEKFTDSVYDFILSWHIAGNRMPLAKSLQEPYSVINAFPSKRNILLYLLNRRQK